MPGYSHEKDDLLRRLRLIKGQVRGLQRMVADDVYCIDVLTQIASVSRALHRVGIGLLADHLAQCVSDAVRESPEAGSEKIAEAVAAVDRLLRS